jgi:hypothetical protein
VVEVGRQPEVFVRPSEPDEAQRVVKVAPTTRDRVRWRHFPWLDDPAWFTRTLAAFLG